MAHHVNSFKYICLALLFVLPWTATAKADIEPFDTIATIEIGVPINVQCVETNFSAYTVQTTDTFGVTAWQNNIFMGPEACKGMKLLNNFRLRSKDDFKYADQYYFMAVALLSFQHEMDHIILNSVDEGVVECYAVHHMGITLKTYWNMPPWLYRIIISNAKDVHRSTPKEYRTVC